MNKIEEYKQAKDGLDVLNDIYRYAKEGWEAITEEDKTLMKWYGIFFRKHTPGYFMIRIRIPNGITNSAQIRTIADITGSLGQGFADITTRQQIQLRGIRIEHVPEILDRLKSVGLSTLQTGMDNIRNVMGCPVAGLTPGELLDASPIVKQFTDIFVGNKDFSNLPRKFNVIITGCPENCTPAESQDVSLVPAIRDPDGAHEIGFNVLVGGKMGSGGFRSTSPLDVWVRPEEAARVCAQIALIYRDHGSREVRTKNRLAFLIEAWGEVKFREELEKRMGYPLQRAGKDVRSSNRSDHIGIYRQKQPGLNYVGLNVPVGRMKTDYLLRVARLAEDYGTGEIRLTPDQNLIIPHVPDTKLGYLIKEPLLKTLRYDPSEIMRGLVSCTGIEFCEFALIETKERSLRTAQYLEQELKDTKFPIRIHWSGCPAGCGNHQIADIGLEGTKAKVDGKVVEAVHIYIGGRSGPEAKRGELLLKDVPCEEVPKILRDLVKYYPPPKKK
jgi:ferredoxin-nitrite reductase